jgi:hypothetical protein
MNAVPFGLPWTAVETDSGWNPSLLETANLFFGAQGLPLYLVILSPINTTVAEVRSLPRPGPGRPGARRRVHRFLDSLRSRLSGVQLDALILGNEIDATLGDDPLAWDRFQRFFDGARDRARTRWGPALRIGATSPRMGWSGSPLGPAIDRLIAASDLASIT